jgi:hypothetical protein
MFCPPSFLGYVFDVNKIYTNFDPGVVGLITSFSFYIPYSYSLPHGSTSPKMGEKWGIRMDLETPFRGSGFKVLGSEFGISGFRCQVSGVGFQGSGLTGSGFCNCLGSFWIHEQKIL